jgi:hypothetical protein
MSQNKPTDEEKKRIACLITGRGLCKFAATGQRLSLHVKIDDEKIPTVILEEK